MSEQRKNNKIELYMISQNINNETKTNSNISLDFIKGKLNTDQTKERIKQNPSKKSIGSLIRDPKTQQIIMTNLIMALIS